MALVLSFALLGLQTGCKQRHATRTARSHNNFMLSMVLCAQATHCNTTCWCGFAP